VGWGLGGLGAGVGKGAKVNGAEGYNGVRKVCGKGVGVGVVGWGWGVGVGYVG